MIKGVTLRIPEGQSVAIVGSSGSGKSTLLKLLLRMYDPTAGRIQMDGHDLTHLSLASVRDAAAVVPQDTALFNDSLLNNIAFGGSPFSLSRSMSEWVVEDIDGAITCWSNRLPLP